MNLEAERHTKMEETETLDQKDRDLIDDDQLKTIVVPEGDELVGRMLDDRFLIEKDLTDGGADKGGMGLVYLAQDMKLMGKKTVVKILRKESLENEDIERKFLHEKEALIRLDHPNIVRILDSGTLTDGNPFMVMEYIPGYSLRKVLREQRQLPFDQCAHFVRQITDALSAAHSEKILHRDIKPENIMLTPQEGSFDRVRLIDFGIAKVQESKLAPETQAPPGIGTILYMAPEQLYGKLNPTQAVDVYSTAIMIFEMLTGQHPFQPVSLVEMFELQKEGLKTMPRSLRSEIPVKAEELLVTALAYEADMGSRRGAGGELSIFASAKDRDFSPSIDGNRTPRGFGYRRSSDCCRRKRGDSR
jgi:serine/threonine-protein kinase